jgi:hypothetical protein
MRGSEKINKREKKMICPHCNKDTVSTYKMYWWPYGTKRCPSCGGASRVKDAPLLTTVSVCLGGLAVVPVIIWGAMLYLIPSLLVVHAIDFAMDRKYRRLIPAEEK